MRNRKRITLSRSSNYRRLNVKRCKQVWTSVQRHGGKLLKRTRLMLSGFVLGLMMLASGCQSHLQITQSVQSQVVIDQSLMEEPSYLQDLLIFLSDKPNEQMTK